MHIKIKNYKNLKEINYHIEENKLNFLFGLCGSGKSSIIDALIAETTENDRTFSSLKDDNQIVEIDNKKVSPTEIHVFNVSKANIILNNTTLKAKS